MYLNPPQYKQFINWLSSNTKNWKPLMATIAPGQAIVSGKSFSLNIHEKSVVLNYEHTDGEYRQLSKTIEKNELVFIFVENP